MSRILFENAGLFDGVTPKVAERMFVLVDGDEIKQVSVQPIEADGAERVDCRGKTLMPGLIDNHIHIYASSLQVLPPIPVTYRAQYAQKFLRHILSCGFTTVRDVAGGDHGMAMALRDGFFEGPRFFYGGLALTQTGGHGDFRASSTPTDFCACCGPQRNIFAVHADGVDECIKAVREELRKGAHHIKIMASGGVISQSDPLERCQYSEAEIRAIVTECERQGSYVCAHSHPAEAIRRCADYGVRSIEHGTLIDDDTAAFVAEKGAHVVPTVAVQAALKETGRDMGLSEASYQKLLRVHDAAFEGLAIMKRAGVKMGFGTDLIGDNHTRQCTEFVLRKQMLSAFDILHSATAVNAEILQMEGRLGVVTAGALADLLVVDGNPLETIELLAASGKHLTHIMVGGRFLKRPDADRPAESATS